MDALTRTAPPPGSANPGDLYVDFQTRTLWLGVDPAVDPEEFVLISDILSFQAEVDGAVVESKAYTDTEILTRAPTVHTHNAAQITDFTTAVQAVIAATPSATINRGLIAMFSGSLAEIGIGTWADWALCDGSNGTPDLRDKFIIGAGNKPVGDKNTPANFKTDVQGAHAHTITVNGTAITEAQMPSHHHGGATGTQSANHTHTQAGTFGTTASGDHTHPAPVSGGFKVHVNGSGAQTGSSGNELDMTIAAATGPGGNHAHNVTISGQTGINSASHTHAIPVAGSDQAHAHTASSSTAGSHDHTITPAQIRETVPYFALAFVMKL